ncbi:MAG: NMD3-related protein [Candidatus Anstonellaceae archaeon]
MPKFPSVRIYVCKKCKKITGKTGVRKEVEAGQEIARILKIKDASPVFSKDFSSVEYQSPYGRLEQKISVIASETVCNVCAMLNSRYYEAIIQLRGERKEIQKAFLLLQRKISSRSVIPKVEELKEGIDIYCASRSEAISALNAQGFGFLRTEKLAGEKNGRRLYRTTLLVRL